MKAKFDISLGHHKNFTALSNMPVIASEPVYAIIVFFIHSLFIQCKLLYSISFHSLKCSANKSDWVLDKFDVTVPMSTYLVAYTINDFEYKESPADGDVVFRIWARRDAISQVIDLIGV